MMTSPSRTDRTLGIRLTTQRVRSTSPSRHRSRSRSRPCMSPERRAPRSQRVHLPVRQARLALAHQRRPLSTHCLAGAVALGSGGAHDDDRGRRLRSLERAHRTRLPPGAVGRSRARRVRSGRAAGSARTRDHGSRRPPSDQTAGQHWSQPRLQVLLGGQVANSPACAVGSGARPRPS